MDSPRAEEESPTLLTLELVPALPALFLGWGLGPPGTLTRSNQQATPSPDSPCRPEEESLILQSTWEWVPAFLLGWGLPLGRCGGLERTNFLNFLLWEGVVGLRLCCNQCHWWLLLWSVRGVWHQGCLLFTPPWGSEGTLPVCCWGVHSQAPQPGQSVGSAGTHSQAGSAKPQPKQAVLFPPVRKECRQCTEISCG